MQDLAVLGQMKSSCFRIVGYGSSLFCNLSRYAMETSKIKYKPFNGIVLQNSEDSKGWAN